MYVNCVLVLLLPREKGQQNKKKERNRSKGRVEGRSTKARKRGEWSTLQRVVSDPTNCRLGTRRRRRRPQSISGGQLNETLDPRICLHPLQRTKKNTAHLARLNRMSRVTGSCASKCTELYLRNKVWRRVSEHQRKPFLSSLCCGMGLLVKATICNCVWRRANETNVVIAT